MDEPIETIEYKDYNINIYYDLDPESPREWDNLTTMICFHRRYDLGDKNDLSSNNFNGWGELKKYIYKKFDPCVILPLWLYDHSGITIIEAPEDYRPYPFNCQWDSGQVGYVFIPRKKMLEEFSRKRMSTPLTKKAYQIMSAEVKTYDQYLRGDVYGYEVCNKEEEGIDSCWGFYGSDHEESGLLEMARDAV